jgi:hydrogenase maturation protease
MPEVLSLPSDDHAQVRMKISVLGLGNVLMGDDAFEPHVIMALEAGWEFPEEVTVLDLGTPGTDLLPYVTEAEALILVDAVRAEGAPGEMRFFHRDEILRHPHPPRLSPHDPGVKEALLSAEFHGQGPREVLLVGVIPARVESGISLSAEVRQAVPAAAEWVIRELVRLGAPLRKRPGRKGHEIWWETR